MPRIDAALSATSRAARVALSCHPSQELSSANGGYGVHLAVPRHSFVPRKSTFLAGCKSSRDLLFFGTKYRPTSLARLLSEYGGLREAPLGCGASGMIRENAHVLSNSSLTEVLRHTGVLAVL